MTMTREQFSSFLEPYLFKVYEEVFEQGPDVVADLFNVQNSTKASETMSGIGGLGLMRSWTGTVHYDTVEALWDVTFTHRQYSLGLRIDRQLWDDAQYPEVRNRADRLVMMVHRTRQLHATSVFDNAFATSYTDSEGITRSSVGPDTVALCGSHPYSPSNSSTQSNAGSTAIGIQAIEDTRILMMNTKDDRGNKMLIKPDTILLGPSLEMQTQEYLESVGRADTGNRVDNVRKGAYKIYVLPFLSDTNNWFMLDSQMMKNNLYWFERRKPVPEKDADFDTEVLKWKMVCRYSFGFLDWRWIYGHSVA